MARGKAVDANRVRKTYPFIRRVPVIAYLMDEPMIIETADVAFSAIDSVVHIFSETFTSVPVVTATASEENVNIYISNVSLTSVTINASAPFTGSCHIQAIQVG
jgi:hypothetical protein